MRRFLLSGLLIGTSGCQTETATPSPPATQRFVARGPRSIRFTSARWSSRVTRSAANATSDAAADSLQRAMRGFLGKLEEGL